ncbi:MAG: hypothetical protein ACI85F_002841 [Bacteroidia bacterium]|jgi:hypothetical protein
MSYFTHVKVAGIAISLLLVILSSSCSTVDKNHEINARWTFVSYEADSILTYDTLVNIDFDNSEDITGEGPKRHFRGSVEVWKDGTLQISNLCCGDTASDSTLLPQIEFYSYLTSCTEYEINGNLMVLRGSNSEMRFEK